MTNRKYISQSAYFSTCNRYRYSLQREFSHGSGSLLFIGLNPSRADADADDPTIRRCAGFANSWGFRKLEVVNLFALCATLPTDLKRSKKPIGPENNEVITAAVQSADLAVACWGIHGNYMDRDQEVLSALPRLHCMGLTKNLQPRHPLYLKADVQTTLMPLGV